MKKLGIISVLVLCLVIGGVYATWDYAQGAVTDQTSNIPINLRGANVSGSKGNIGATGGSSLNIYIDDADGNHLADKATGEGTLNITFEPSSSADAAVQKDGIILEFVLSTNYELPTYTYKGVQVFTNIDTTPQALAGGVATKSATITGAQIADLITVNPQLHLATKAEYDEFYRTLAAHGFTITIREKVAPIV